MHSNADADADADADANTNTNTNTGPNSEPRTGRLCTDSGLLDEPSGGLVHGDHPDRVYELFADRGHRDHATQREPR